MKVRHGDLETLAFICFQTVSAIQTPPPTLPGWWRSSTCMCAGFLSDVDGTNKMQQFLMCRNRLSLPTTVFHAFIHSYIEQNFKVLLHVRF